MSEISKAIQEAQLQQANKTLHRDCSRKASDHNYVYGSYSYASVKNSAKAFAATVVGIGVVVYLLMSMCNEVR